MSSLSVAKPLNEIEMLIDLEMHLDKEFLNEDSYASAKNT